MMKNSLSLQTISRIAVFIILLFSVYFLFAGHNNPGGGFIGGLMAASALVLLYLSFGTKKINKVIRINFPYLIATGLLIAMATGVISVIFGYPFLTQFYEYFHFPLLGKAGLATALLFDAGVFLVVIGVTILVILTIAEDDD
ncbi:Na(+)/H(+) antiporter subunit B [Aquibacillus koreensis]|uniref:Na(+)/H(+) antiporter subunit B n=1 Tax=Aquibacillus koreensis TaxID=279446 RepID=A0A9X3WJI7_9BACI|nr:Na(+)/H(+) antiporter subunit B [Aquibacillus koreensis]MCT2538196.1 Na(+)/H(+) antiporter subunit B [Aquibacillus koreensis]MDC3420860.1 Na(+)/H(+) antiporter subunit B [Aquibacillus koreensis]